LEGERSKEDALSEADAKVLEGQNSGDEQAPETEGNSTDAPPLTGTNRDEDGEAEDELGDTGTEAKQDLVAVADHDEDEIDVDPGAGDEAQPFRWQSDVLCVADPFIETRVKFSSKEIDALSDATFLITEPCWTHQTECCRTVSRRLPACGDATTRGGKPWLTLVI